MATVYLEDGRLADEFEIGPEPYVLKDALVMHPEEYALLTAEDISAMKRKRYENWIAIINSPPADVPIEDASADPAV